MERNPKKTASKKVPPAPPGNNEFPADEIPALQPVLDEEKLADLHLGFANVPLSMIEAASDKRRARRINQRHVELLKSIFMDKDPNSLEIILTGIISEVDQDKCLSLQKSEVIALAEQGELHIEVNDGNHRVTVVHDLVSAGVGKWTTAVKIRVSLYLAMTVSMALAFARKQNLDKAQCRKETVFDEARLMRLLKLQAQNSINLDDEIKTGRANVTASNKRIREVMGLSTDDTQSSYKYMYRLAQKNYAVWKVYDAFAVLAENGEIAEIAKAKSNALSRGVAGEFRFAISIFKDIINGCKTDGKIIEVLTRCMDEKSYVPMVLQNKRKPKLKTRKPPAEQPPRKRRRSSSEHLETADTSSDVVATALLTASTVESDGDADSQKTVEFWQNENAELEKEVLELKAEREKLRSLADASIVGAATADRTVSELERKISEQQAELVLLRLNSAAASDQLSTHTHCFLDKNLNLYRGGKVDKEGNVNANFFGTLSPDTERYVLVETSRSVEADQISFISKSLVTPSMKSKPPFVEVRTQLLESVFPRAAK